MSYDFLKDFDEIGSKAYEQGKNNIKKKAVEAFCKQLHKDSHYCELAMTTNYSCRESCPLYGEFIKQLV